jgi:hypothetical protein
MGTKDATSTAPFGDLFAIVEREGDRKPAWIQCGVVWAVAGGFSFDVDSEPLAWRTHVKGYTWPQERHFVIRKRERSGTTR